MLTWVASLNQEVLIFLLTTRAFVIAKLFEN